ncbi:hypothetical protein BDL97_07G004000 [Sphagnum fallax]|nr:hypothetical protein BDL97_07G004000 [Sphagnum fallax]
MSEISSSRAMATPLIAGIAVAVTALAGKYGIEAWQAFKTRQAVPTVRKYYEGGFQAVMTRREAARILGVRESVAQDKVKEAHRRVMQANHPDAGGYGRGFVKGRDASSKDYLFQNLEYLDLKGKHLKLTLE